MVKSPVPPGYAEVVIQFSQPRYFSRIWGTAAVPITAYAVAQAQWAAAKGGIIVLDPTAAGSLRSSGNGTARVTGASVIADSNNSNAVTVNGRALVSDSGSGTVAITGQSPGYSGNVQGQILTGQPPTPDPFAYLPAPDPTTLPLQTVPEGDDDGIFLHPGRYVGGISTNSNARIQMAPGIYYMDGGDFDYTGNGSLTGSGVMIYSTTGIRIAGNASVRLSPPATGPYTGMTFFVARNSASTIQVSGNGTYNVSGTIYNANGLTTVSGNGDVSLAGQIVTDQLSVSGNGDVNIVWGSAPTARSRSIQLVD